jgi:hypothetical protein
MAMNSAKTSNLPGTHLALTEGTTGATTQIDNPNQQLSDAGPTGTGAVKRIGNTKIENPA